MFVDGRRNEARSRSRAWCLWGVRIFVFFFFGGGGLRVCMGFRAFGTRARRGKPGRIIMSLSMLRSLPLSLRWLRWCSKLANCPCRLGSAAIREDCRGRLGGSLAAASCFPKAGLSGLQHGEFTWPLLKRLGGRWRQHWPLHLQMAPLSSDGGRYRMQRQGEP